MWLPATPFCPHLICALHLAMNPFCYEFLMDSPDSHG